MGGEIWVVRMKDLSQFRAIRFQNAILYQVLVRTYDNICLNVSGPDIVFTFQPLVGTNELLKSGDHDVCEDGRNLYVNEPEAVTYTRTDRDWRTINSTLLRYPRYISQQERL